MSDNDTPNREVEHSLKTEKELLKEYHKLREHLAVFWMYRPRNKALRSAYPDTVKELERRVDFLEDILQIPESDCFDYEEFDQNEIN